VLVYFVLAEFIRISYCLEDGPNELKGGVRWIQKAAALGRQWRNA